MPNDSSSGEQFPVPSASPQPPTQPEIKLTDEVAPDLSAPATPPSFVEATPPTPAPPVQPTPPSPVIPAAIPASAASFTPSRPFPLVTLLLILIAIAATAATYFFYQQSQNLGQQLNQLNQTINQQQTQPTPTLSLSETLTPTIEISPATTLSASPTPTLPAGRETIFGSIANVVSLATNQYPNSQLILIMVSGAEDPSLTLTKYWFRKSSDTKTYFYLQKQSGKDPAIVDSGGKVTPDDNIPSLNQLALSGKLGTDLDQAISLATTACPPTYKCTDATIQAQYIKNATTLLWQVTFQTPGVTKPFVIQIDATTSKVLYKNQ